MYGSIISPVIPMACGLMGRRFLSNLSSILIFFLAGISFSADVASYILANLYGNNYPVVNFYLVCETLLVGSFFYLILRKNKLVILIYLFLFIAFVGRTIRDGLFYYQHEFIPYLNLANIFFLIFVLINIFKNSEELFIENNPNFWFTTGLLFYFSGSLFTDLLSSEILNGPMLWVFHNIANILKNILFAIGLWKVRVAT